MPVSSCFIIFAFFALRRKQGDACRVYSSLCALYFARTQAAGTYIYGLVGSADNGLYLTDIRLPSSVGFTVGVRYVMSEDYSLSAYTTLCHLSDTS